MRCFFSRMQVGDCGPCLPHLPHVEMGSGAAVLSGLIEFVGSAEAHAGLSGENVKTILMLLVMVIMTLMM